MQCRLVYQTGPGEWDVEDEEYHGLPIVFPGMQWKWNRDMDTAFVVSKICYVAEGRYYEVYLKPFKVSTGEMLYEENHEL